MTLRKLHSKYVRNTPYNSEVSFESITLGTIIYPATSSIEKNVEINTVTLKHLYDKRTAREYDLILDGLELSLMQITNIFRNNRRENKSYLLLTNYREEMIVIVTEESSTNTKIITAFCTSWKYLKNFKCVWSREDGLPPS